MARSNEEDSVSTTDAEGVTYLVSQQFHFRIARPYHNTLEERMAEVSVELPKK